MTFEIIIHMKYMGVTFVVLNNCKNQDYEIKEKKIYRSSLIVILYLMQLHRVYAIFKYMLPLLEKNASLLVEK